MKLKNPEVVFSISPDAKLNLFTNLHKIITHAKHLIRLAYLTQDLCIPTKGSIMQQTPRQLHCGCTLLPPPPWPPPSLPYPFSALLGATQSVSLCHAKQFSRHLSLMDKALGTSPSTLNVIAKYFF